MADVTAFPYVHVPTLQLQGAIRLDPGGWLSDLGGKEQWNDLHEAAKTDHDGDQYAQQTDIFFYNFM
jgi:hypothetical protein